MRTEVTAPRIINVDGDEWLAPRSSCFASEEDLPRAGLDTVVAKVIFIAHSGSLTRFVESGASDSFDSAMPTHII
jgi:hypothetical protein